MPDSCLLLRILRNFQKQFFFRTLPGDCFWLCVTAISERVNSHSMAKKYG